MSRRVCRACEGDGHLMAEPGDDTPPEERRGRFSRVCTYCGGSGYITESTPVKKPKS